jgi:hypothetical protein
VLAICISSVLVLTTWKMADGGIVRKKDHIMSQEAEKAEVPQSLLRTFQ